MLGGNFNAPDFTEVTLRYNAPAQSALAAWMMTADAIGKWTSAEILDKASSNSHISRLDFHSRMITAVGSGLPERQVRAHHIVQQVNCCTMTRRRCLSQVIVNIGQGHRGRMYTIRQRVDEVALRAVHKQVVDSRTYANARSGQDARGRESLAAKARVSLVPQVSPFVVLSYIAYARVGG